jgi:hypothetical protein
MVMIVAIGRMTGTNIKIVHFKVDGIIDPNIFIIIRLPILPIEDGHTIDPYADLV